MHTGSDDLNGDGNLEMHERKGYDYIIFQFPHVGGRSTDMQRQVRANQELLSGFLGAAKGLLRAPAAYAGNCSTQVREQQGKGEEHQQGKIIVTLFDGLPYSLWNIRDLARHAGLMVVRSERFDGKWWAERGYRHARTFGDVRGKGGDGRGGTGVEEEHSGDDDDWSGFSDAEGSGEDDGLGAGYEAQKRQAGTDVVQDGNVSGTGRRPGKWRGEERPARSYIFGLMTSDGSAINSAAKRKKRYDVSDEDE